MKRYPKEVHDFIRRKVKGVSAKNLAEMVNAEFGTDFTEERMKSYKHNHKLKSGTKMGNTTGQSKVFPNEVQDFIRKKAKGIGNVELTELINRTFQKNYRVQQIKSYKNNHKISSGLNGWFEKGHVPANKGKKGFVAPGSEKGWFQSGHTPVNHREVGSERVDAKDGYILVKVAEPNVWKPKHVVIWEEAHGKVPKGQKLIFLDRDKTNITLDNLAVVSDSELLEMNRSKLFSRDAELTKTGIIVAKVRRKMFARKKG